MKYFQGMIIFFYLSCIISCASIPKQNIKPIRQGMSIEWNDAFTTIEAGIVYVWSDTRNGDRDLYAQLVSKDGKKLWRNEGLLLDGKINRQEDPVITTTSDGNVIVAYLDYSDFGKIIIRAHKISPKGKKLLGNDGIIICSLKDSQIKSLNISADKKGGAYISWIDDRTGIFLAYTQHIASTPLITRNEAIHTSSPVIARNEAIHTSGSLTFPENGLRIGDEDTQKEDIVTYPDGQGGILFLSLNSKTREEILQENKKKSIKIDDEIIGYYRDPPQKTSAPIMSRIDETGVIWTDLILTEQRWWVSEPIICSDGEDGFVVGWMDEKGGSYSRGCIQGYEWTFRLFLQRVTLDGTIHWGNEGLRIINRDSTNKPAMRITTVETGGVIVGWHSSRSQFFAQRINIKGNFRWREEEKFRTFRGGDTYAIDRDFQMVGTIDGAFLVFEDLKWRTEQSRIFVHKLNLDGSLLFDRLGKTISDPDLFVFTDLRGIVHNDGEFTIIYTEDNRSNRLNSVKSQNLILQDNNLSIEASLSITEGVVWSASEYIVKTWKDLTYIVWTDHRYHIYYQIIDGKGKELLPTNGARIKDYVYRQNLYVSNMNAEINEFGDLCIIWVEQDVGGRHPCYAQIINNKGEKLLSDSALLIPGYYSLHGNSLGSSYSRSSVIVSKGKDWDIYWVIYDSSPRIGYLNQIKIIDTESEEERFTVETTEIVQTIYYPPMPVAVIDDYILYSRQLYLDLTEKEEQGLARRSYPNKPLSTELRLFYPQITEIDTLGKKILTQQNGFSFTDLFLADENLVIFTIPRNDSNLRVTLLDFEGNIVTEDPFYNIATSSSFVNAYSYQISETFSNPSILQINSDFYITYSDSLGSIRTQKITLSNQDIIKSWGDEGSIIYQPSEDKQSKHPVSALHNGNIVVSWIMDNALFYNIISPEGSLFYDMDGILVCGHPNQPHTQRIVSHSNKDFSIIWLDDISLGKDNIQNIYMKRVNRR